MNGCQGVKRHTVAIKNAKRAACAKHRSVAVSLVIERVGG